MWTDVTQKWPTQLRGFYNLAESLVQVGQAAGNVPKYQQALSESLLHYRTAVELEALQQSPYQCGLGAAPEAGALRGSDPGICASCCAAAQLRGGAGPARRGPQTPSSQIAAATIPAGLSLG